MLETRVLRLGDLGGDVAEFQRRRLDLADPDGAFGPVSRTMTLTLERELGRDADGIWTPGDDAAYAKHAQEVRNVKIARGKVREALQLQRQAQTLLADAVELAPRDDRLSGRQALNAQRNSIEQAEEFLSELRDPS
jgi:hypothetical protein